MDKKNQVANQVAGNQVAKPQAPQNQVEVVQTSAVTEPVNAPAAKPVMAEEVKKYVVNCYRCGAALNVRSGNMVYMCPVCNNLFRVRLGEKLVKDISRVIVSEAYVNVNKGLHQ